jgi:hypothetical protein
MHQMRHIQSQKSLKYLRLHLSRQRELKGKTSLWYLYIHNATKRSDGASIVYLRSAEYRSLRGDTGH